MATRTTSAMEEYRQRMAEEGRRPSFSSDGEIRGYRSRPGAPTAGVAEFGKTNMTGGSGATKMDAWNSFFHKDRQPVAVSAPQVGQTNINPGVAPTIITPPPSNIALAPSNPPDAASMAATQPRPYSQPTANPSDLYSSGIDSHSRYLGGFNPTYAETSVTPLQANRIGMKYGGKTTLSAKLDNSFDSLLQ